MTGVYTMTSPIYTRSVAKHLVDIDEATGVVTVELMGACVTCPTSTQTLKAGIERIMKDRVEGVTEVVEVNALGMSESPVSL